MQAASGVGNGIDRQKWRACEALALPHEGEQGERGIAPLRQRTAKRRRRRHRLSGETEQERLPDAGV
jgi:hypothetical protein